MCVWVRKRGDLHDSSQFFPENEKRGPESERFRTTVRNLKNIVKLLHLIFPPSATQSTVQQRAMARNRTPRRTAAVDAVRGRAWQPHLTMPKNDASISAKREIIHPHGGSTSST